MSVSVLDTLVDPAEMNKPIEMPFVDSCGPKKPYIKWECILAPPTNTTMRSVATVRLLSNLIYYAN